MRRRRKLWIILLATPLILVAADAFYWRMTERSLEDGFAAWLSERRAAGWTATAQPPVRGGWPLAATLTVPGIALKGGDPEIPGGLAWGADRVILRVSLLRPGVLDVAAGGMQHIRFADNPEVPFTADRLRVVLPLQPDAAPQAMDVTCANLRAGMPAGKDATAGLTVGLLQLHADIRQPEQSGGSCAGIFAARGRNQSAARCGRAARSAHWQLQHGRRSGRGGAAGGYVGGSGCGLARRRRFPGNTAIGAELGPARSDGQRHLALDEQLQPMGAGSARVVGYAETLDALAAHGVISRSAATAAKAVLSLLAHTARRMAARPMSRCR